MKSEIIFLGLLFLFIFIDKSYAGLPVGSKPGAVEKEVKKGFDGKEVPEKREAPSLLEKYEVKEAPAPKGTAHVFVKEFKFAGSTIFSEKELQEELHEFINKELSMDEINQAIAKINNKYRILGFIWVSVIIPEQQIKESIISVDIIEGRVGNIVISGANHYSENFIRNHFHPTIKGILNYNQLVKSLLVLNEYLGLHVKSILERGSMPGTADIFLDITDKKPIRAGMSYNNYGTKYVSKRRQGMFFEMGNFVMPGADFSVTGIYGSPLNSLAYNQYSYTFPINKHNTKVDFKYLRSSFQARESYVGFESEGKSQIYSTGLSHPLIRNQNTYSNIGLLFDYADIKNYQIEAKNIDDQLRVLRIDYRLEHADTYKGINSMDLRLSFGMDDIMGASRDDNTYASRSGGGADYVKANLDIYRVQDLFGDFKLGMRLSAQSSDTTLPIYEQISLGGANSVRGYAESEYLGDSGYITSLELTTPLPFLLNKKVPFIDKRWKDVVRFACFFDHGGIYLERAGAGEGSTEYIRGAGVGLRITLPDDLSIILDWAWPLGKEPRASNDSAFYIKISKEF